MATSVIRQFLNPLNVNKHIAKTSASIGVTLRYELT